MAEAGLSRPRMHRSKKISFAFTAVLLCVTVLCGSLEALARLRGHGVWVIQDPARIRIEPAGEGLYRTDPALGYAHRPGTYRVTLPSGHRFEITHNQRGLRICRPAADSDPGGRPQLWIFGCSFTHGWSLDDAQTYPWLIQQRLPGIDVVNYGVGGYNTVQSLMQCDRALREGSPPELVVLAYASFHDERNASLRSWKRMLVTYNGHNEMLRYPYARFDRMGRLRLSVNADVRFDLPLSKISALALLMERWFEAAEERSVRPHDISKGVIMLFDRLCRAKGVRLMVAGIEPDPKTREMLEFCRRQGIPSADISVDLDREHLRNLPHDTHPGPAANRLYADRLYKAVLRQRSLAGVVR